MQTQIEGAEAISGEELTEMYLIKNDSGVALASTELLVHAANGNEVAEALKNYKIIMLRGPGSKAHQ